MYARFEGFETKEELKAARKGFRIAYTRAIREAGQRVILPLAKRAAPAIAGHALTTKANTKGAYITTLGPRKSDDIIGLVNFGGTQRGKIVPKDAQALFLREKGIVVASVGKEGEIRARYKGNHFLERAIDAGVPEMEHRAEKYVMEAFGGV